MLKRDQYEELCRLPMIGEVSPGEIELTGASPRGVVAASGLGIDFEYQPFDVLTRYNDSVRLDRKFCLANIKLREGVHWLSNDSDQRGVFVQAANTDSEHVFGLVTLDDGYFKPSLAVAPG